MSQETRDSKDIIANILSWSSEADLLTLEQHITEEMGKLKRKQEKRSGFIDHYQERSGELVSTMIGKLEASQKLLHKWRQGDYTISETDKLAVSDLLEFINNPFSRFAGSANETLGEIANTGLLNSVDGTQSLAEKTSRTLSNNATAYEDLRELLVELCDSVGYVIPDNVRRGEARNDWGLGR